MALARIPTGLLLIVAALVLAAMGANQSPVSYDSVNYARQQAASGGATGANQFDPTELCKQYDAAFTAAGVPNICTAAQNSYVNSRFGSVQLRDKNAADEIIAQIDWGRDPIKSFAYRNIFSADLLEEGVQVYTTNVHVFRDYAGQGVGKAIVKTYQPLLRTLGASANDIHLIVASPSNSMPWGKQQSWLNFVAQYCAQLPGAIALSQGIGCYYRVGMP